MRLISFMIKYFISSLALLFPSYVTAQDSTYTELNIEQGCTLITETVEGTSASYQCQGFENYPVYWTFGDLREFVRFGYISDSASYYETFAEWNYVNTTIEWRLDNGIPFATILRWFIDNVDPVTGSVDPAMRGQVLVVSRVANTPSEQSCMVGLVDARANADANVLAREVADGMARKFNCGSDLIQYYGDVGRYAPSPP